jgi:hypothetical protein
MLLVLSPLSSPSKAKPNQFNLIAGTALFILGTGLVPVLIDDRMIYLINPSIKHLVFNADVFIYIIPVPSCAVNILTED